MNLRQQKNNYNSWRIKSIHRKPQPHNNPTASSKQASPTASQSCSHTIHVSLPVDQVRNKVLDYSKRCLVGLLFGPRPSIEAMRAWVKDCWTNIGIEVTLTQALAKGYYLFMFKEASMAMKFISLGQWMFRHLPFCCMRWTKDFNPNGPKPIAYPVWVELPNLPIHLNPYINTILSPLGQVLGTRAYNDYNPAWHPQVLVELDLPSLFLTK